MRKRYSISVNPNVMEQARKAAGLVPLSRWIEFLMVRELGCMVKPTEGINEPMRGYENDQHSGFRTDRICVGIMDELKENHT